LSKIRVPYTKQTNNFEEIIMSTNALSLALLFGILFAIGDRLALHIGDRYSRNTGTAVWAILVMAPTVILAMLSFMAAGVAIVVGLVASYALGRFIANKSRRHADPFAQPRLSLRWLR
jgi:predicted MFS family arabinose efflux permease